MSEPINLSGDWPAIVSLMRVHLDEVGAIRGKGRPRRYIRFLIPACGSAHYTVSDLFNEYRSKGWLISFNSSHKRPDLILATFKKPNAG